MALGIALGAGEARAGDVAPGSNAIEVGLQQTADLIAEDLKLLPESGKVAILISETDQIPEWLKGYPLHIIPSALSNYEIYPFGKHPDATATKCFEALSAAKKDGIKGVVCVWYSFDQKSNEVTVRWELLRRALPGVIADGSTQISPSRSTMGNRSAHRQKLTPVAAGTTIAVGTALAVGGGVICRNTYAQYKKDKQAVWGDERRTFRDPWIAPNAIAGGALLVGVSAVAAVGIDVVLFHHKIHAHLGASVDAGAWRPQVMMGGSF